MLSTSRDRCRITVLAFSDASRDGRTLNICRTVAAIGDVTLWNLEPTEHAVPWKWCAARVARRGRMRWRWLQFVVAVLWHCRRKRSDIVWAADVYCLLPAVVLRWLHGAAVVYDSRELYSSLGTLARRPIAQRLLAWYERVLVRWVDRVVASGIRDAELLAQLLPLRQPAVVVMNVPFYAEPQRTDRLRQRCAIPPEAPILLYQGAVLEGRGIRNAIEMLQYLPTVHFCILGDGSARDAIAAYAAECAVAARVHVLGSVPYQELLEWTASADVGWCWIEPITESYALALPNKLFEYAMARIPVLASRLPAMADVLEQYPFGICVEPTATARELAAAVEQLLGASERFRRWADIAARQYCYERQQEVICSLVHQLCNR